MPDVIENVSDTAFGVAHYRALESQRPDPLFHDPLASVLAGDHGRQIAAAMPIPAMGRQIIVLRTRIIDDYIRLAIAEGVDAVLNLGAGLDTRPYRMELPNSLLWIEADYAPVIELKEERLSAEKPRCRLERVKIDLANVTERRKLFADVHTRAKKTLVITEGVLPYLTEEEVGSLADDLQAAAHAAYWIAEYVSPEAMKFRKRRRMGRNMQNAPWKFSPEDWFGFFTEHGWRLKEIRYLVEEADRLKRPLQLPLLLKITVGIQKLFAPKEKRGAFDKFQGYCLFEPSSDLP
jgi:methyltransferase (TIGR00027 family)